MCNSKNQENEVVSENVECTSSSVIPFLKVFGRTLSAFLFMFFFLMTLAATLSMLLTVSNGIEVPDPTVTKSVIYILLTCIFYALMKLCS